MKLTVAGGGGFRVPMVYGALLARRDRLPFDDVVLYDVDAARLERIEAVLQGLAAEHGAAVPFTTTTDLDQAIEGADFVFSAIRVGRLEGRVVDESVPLALEVLGQETTGPGGICFALRTIPAVMEIAHTILEKAPGGWLQAARDGRRDRLPELLADDEKLATFEEGRLFGADWLRTLGMIPNEYLYYFYYGADTVQSIRRQPQPRGAFLLEQQAAFYAADGQAPEEALASWRATRHDRERSYMAEARSAAGITGEHEEWSGDPGGYEGEAMALVDAIANNVRTVMILNTANRSALPFLDEHAVVEVPSLVGRAGPVPTAAGPVPEHARALIATIKDVERTTIEASLTGSADLAIRALALHPLVPSVSVARRIFAGYRERLPELQERFAA